MPNVLDVAALIAARDDAARDTAADCVALRAVPPVAARDTVAERDAVVVAARDVAARDAVDTRDVFVFDVRDTVVPPVRDAVVVAFVRDATPDVRDAASERDADVCADVRPDTTDPDPARDAAEIGVLFDATRTTAASLRPAANADAVPIQHAIEKIRTFLILVSMIMLAKFLKSGQAEISKKRPKWGVYYFPKIRR